VTEGDGSIAGRGPRDSRTWVLAIVGLLGANVVAMTVLAVTANNGGTQVIPAYYDKAAHYDDELDRAQASRALGWHAGAGMSGGAIEVVVLDAAGAAIDGASVRVTGYQRAHAAELLDVTLAAVGGGHYRGQVRGRRGWHDLTVLAERAGARYTQHVAIEAR
jgi:nitrogen fixation protein FixH